MLYLYNTLTKKKEEFQPLVEGEVKMYHCGPTVYNFAHIGNLRMYVNADILRRMLERLGYKTTQVLNITDVGHLTSDADTGEDKMSKGLAREGLDMNLEGMLKLGDKYAAYFLEDLKALNIITPHHTPKASDHIEEDIEIIHRLEKKGFTYETDDGLYFDTSKDLGYAKLRGGLPHEEGLSRVEGSKKKNAADFALWKKDSHIGWASPWGNGFPGWHIECSAMSWKYLGESFDIHTGGVDHIDIHHTNEIAQSENAFGKPMARYWLHGEFLLIDNKKVAKSSGNDLYLRTVIEKGFEPLALRYLFLSAHYRSEINFTWEALEASQTTLMRLREQFHVLPEGGSPDLAYQAEFESFIGDDLNTAKALALVWQLLKDPEMKSEDKKATLKDFDEVLGLDLNRELVDKSLYESEIPEKIKDLIQKREEARTSKDWEKADALREKIEKEGYILKDSQVRIKVEKAQ